MNRRNLLKTLSAVAASSSMNINAKENKENRMPVLFIGHGSPMHILSKNNFTETLNKVGEKIKPKAILVISAHWLTEGETLIQINKEQNVIYDFYGFPDELYKIKYSPKGSPDLANKIMKSLNDINIKESNNIGLDHGAWSVLTHLYPKANIPTFQLSIDYSKPPEYHFELGKKLSFLRDNGVLIIGSGNIVHNLKILDRKPSTYYFDKNASREFAHILDEKIVENLKNKNIKNLINYKNLPGAKMGIETPDHYYPFLYALGAAYNENKFKENYIIEGFDLGTLSMRSIEFI